MDLTHLHSLTHIHKESLASLLKVNKTLSYSQANINLLVGHSLRHHSSRESLKTYLSLIPLLESLEIKGSPKVGNIDYLINFIENYYQTLSELQEKSENQRIQAKVRETVSQHIKEKLSETLIKLGSNLKMTEKLKFVTILNCWSYLDLETSAAEEIFEHLSRYFTQELRVSHKNEVVLVAVFRLIIKTLKVNGELFQLYKEKVAALFKRAQAICKKYLGNKNTKEKSFLIACEFILLTLGSDCTEDGRLADVQLPSLYGKSYYVESYFCYFFKHTYQVLKRPNITAKFMLACKANLVNYVKKREDCLETTLNSLFGLLKLTEEPEVTIILIRTIYELFVQSSVKARNKYLVPFILTSKQDLKTKVSSDLISLLVKLVEEDQFKSIDKLFAYIHLDLNEDEIHWVVKVVKGLPNYWKISEIIKIFLLNYKRMILDQKITTELIKALVNLSEVFPNIIIEEVLATINELLLTHEKNRWIRGSEQESSTSLKRYLSLLTVIKASAKYLTSFITSNKISEFWLIITHFSVHYSLTEVISLIDLNETLHAVARLTPNLFMSSSKESQSIFAQLSQSDNFVSVFAPNLRTGLSAFCGKKYFLFRVLDQYDYQVLIIVAAVKKYLDLIDCDRLFEELFGYLGLDTLTFHSALTELISGYIHERWKEIIRSRQVPLQETLSLLKHCLSQNKSVRALAMKMLTGNSESVVTLFHGVLYHYPCLALMLDLISGLELQSNFEYSSTIPYVQLPHLNEALAVPCYKATLTEIKSVLENSFKEMFVKCVWQSHSHILSTFQFYLFSSNKILKTNEDPQVASVINHSQHFFNQCFYSTRFIPNDKFSLIQSYLTPEKFHSWFKQQKMTCEVKVLENNSVQLQNNLLLMADSFIQNEGKLSFLVSELKKAASSTDSPDKPSELFDALGKLTAFLIIKKDLEVPSELVHIPLEISPSTAVFFWEWLINMRPLSRRKIFLEVSFAWLNFLKFHHFLYSSVNFRIKPDLLNGHCMEFKAGPGEFRQVLDLVVFLQKQFYSTTHDLDSQKILLKIFEMTFEEKPSADVLSFEAGLEAVLRILETFIVSRSFFDDLMFSRTFAKMVEFCLFFFRNGHSWVKALTFSQESRIQALFEKVIHGLHDVKISPETVQINDYQFFNTPATWKTRKNSEILVFAVKEKISVQVTKEKVEILMIFLYRDYQRFIAWNSCLHGKIISW